MHYGVGRMGSRLGWDWHLLASNTDIHIDVCLIDRCMEESCYEWMERILRFSGMIADGHCI
jgi:hypothetical protein